MLAGRPARSGEFLHQKPPLLLFIKLKLSTGRR
jgi:hypothetical protein